MFKRSLRDGWEQTVRCHTEKVAQIADEYLVFYYWINVFIFGLIDYIFLVFRSKYK